MAFVATNRVLRQRPIRRRPHRLGSASDAVGQIGAALVNATQPIINAEANSIQYGANAMYAPSPLTPAYGYAQPAATASASPSIWLIGGLVLLGGLFFMTRSK